MEIDRKVIGYKNTAGAQNKIIIAKAMINYFIDENTKILEAYAGTGGMTELYNIKTNDITCIELEEEKFKILKERFPKLKLYHNDNILILKELISGEKKYDIIDLDPYGGCPQQIQLASKLIDNGMLIITTGEFNYVRRFGHIPKIYQELGYKIETWKDFNDVLHDFIKKRFNNANLLFQYNFNKISRIVYSIGQVNAEKIQSFKRDIQFINSDFTFEKRKQKTLF